VQSSDLAATADRSADPFQAASYAEWTRRALRVRAADPDIAVLFDSTIGEPAAELAALVRQAFADPVSSRYVSVFADGNRFALAALARRYGLKPDQLIATTGATAALSLVLRSLLQPGDEVLAEQPGFDIHSRMIAEVGCRLKTFPRPSPAFGVDIEAVLGRMTPQTRVVLITNLHNPSGAYLEPEAIVALAQALAPSGAVLVVDEVYADFAADRRAPPAAKLGANVITISSLTKVFGLFSLKFGWLAADPALVAKVRQAAPDGDIGVSKLSHAVAAHVLEAPEAFEAHWRRTLSATRPAVVAAAEALRREGVIEGEVPPFGCMYFPRVVGVEDTIGLARELFERHRVLVAPGEYFGAPGHVRIGFGADPPMIAQGLERFAEGLRARR
jgi:aspartate/methionine/tyrosine aminotransferase